MSKRKQQILSNGNNDFHAQVNVCHLFTWSCVSINVLLYEEKDPVVRAPHCLKELNRAHKMWPLFKEKWTAYCSFFNHTNKHTNRQLPQFEMFYCCIVKVSYNQDSLLLKSKTRSMLSFIGTKIHLCSSFIPPHVNMPSPLSRALLPPVLFLPPKFTGSAVEGAFFLMLICSLCQPHKQKAKLLIFTCLLLCSHHALAHCVINCFLNSISKA